MKNFICILLITLHCQVFGVAVPAESFKQALQHVINSATKSKFSDIQGEKFETLKKGNNVIEKYQTIDSLPGSVQNYIQISFARSFRSVLFSSTEITDEMKDMFNLYSGLVKQCTPECWWFVAEVTHPDGNYKSLSASRKQKSEVNVYPDINLEIVKKNGMYVLQLSVNI